MIDPGFIPSEDSYASDEVSSSPQKEFINKTDSSTNTPEKVSKTQMIVSKTLSFIVSVVTITLFIGFAGFLINKICNLTLDKWRLEIHDTNEIQYFVNYTSKDNLYRYQHKIFVSCRFEGKKAEKYDQIFLFDGSTAATHGSAQMFAKTLRHRYASKMQDVLFCTYDRIGHGNSETKRTLLDSKNRFTIRHVDKDLYVKNSIVRYSLEVAKSIHTRFGGKLILIGHGFGANVQSAVVAMKSKDRDIFKGLILLDPIQGDELRRYIRQQTNRGMFLTLTGAMRLLTQILRIPLPLRIAAVTSLGSPNYLSDQTIIKRNLLLCQQRLWESARDEVDLLPVLHSLIVYREKRYIGQIPVYVLFSELVDPSDEDLNFAYQSMIQSSQYLKLSKNTSYKVVPHITTAEIVDSVDYIAEAVETIEKGFIKTEKK